MTKAAIPTIGEIDKLSAESRNARKRLDTAVVKRFPEGRHILVLWGRGWMEATSLGVSRDGQLRVVSRNGNVHSRWYRDVRLLE